MNLAYHYTSCASLAGIIRTGAIEPRTHSHWLDPYATPPAVWLSKAPAWEPACSATVEIGPDGELPPDTVPGSPFEAARIAVRERDTRPWDTALLRRLAHWSVLWRLYHTGRDIGSDPGLWRVCIEPVPMNRWVAVEIWDGERWAPLAADDGAYTVEALNEMIWVSVADAAAEEGGRREAV